MISRRHVLFHTNQWKIDETTDRSHPCRHRSIDRRIACGRGCIAGRMQSIRREGALTCFQQHKKRKRQRVRHHHRRRRLGGLGHGPPPLRAKRQQGPALRSRPGHAARQRTAGDPRQLFGHGLFRSALPLDRAQGHHRRSSATTTRKRTARRCANTSRRACWAAAPRSTARWPIAARRPTTTSGKRAAPTGWNWNDVLPYFRKVERDLDFDGPLHGKDGRIPVRRIPREHWTRHTPGGGRGLQARRLQVPAGPERRVRRRLFPGDASPTRTSSASRPRSAISIARRASARNLTISTDTRSRNCCSRARAASASRRWSTAGSRNSAAARSFCPAAPSIRRRICCAPASARSGT